MVLHEAGVSTVQKIDDFLNLRRHKTAGIVYQVFIYAWLLIVLICFALLSDPSIVLKHGPNELLDLELTGMCILTADFILRFAVTRPLKKFFYAISHFAELAIYVVFFVYHIMVVVYVNSSDSDYYSEAVEIAAFLQVIRVLLLLRVLENFEVTKVVLKTFRKSSATLMLLVIVLFSVVSIAATLMYFAELTAVTWDDEKNVWMRADGTKSPFQSIPETMWWSVVTVTTVGYGDTYPVSPLGKIVATFTMLIGILLLSLPIASFGCNFIDLWKEYNEEREARKKAEENGLESAKEHDMTSIDVSGGGPSDNNTHTAESDLKL